MTTRPGTVCWSCLHFSFQGGSAGYSDMTPGYDASMRCGKDVWRFDFDSASQRELERTLRTAETCDKFEARPVLHSVEFWKCQQGHSHWFKPLQCKAAMRTRSGSERECGDRRPFRVDLSDVVSWEVDEDYEWAIQFIRDNSHSTHAIFASEADFQAMKEALTGVPRTAAKS